jgi:hypothetical protein
VPHAAGQGPPHPAHPVGQGGRQVDHRVPVAIHDRGEVAAAIAGQVLDAWRQGGGPIAAIEHADAMAARQGRAHMVRPDNPCAAQDQDAQPRRAFIVRH